MSLQTFYDSGLFHWVLLPLLIFVSRCCDVTLGTLRNIFLSKNLKTLVPVIGFFEVMIWIVAVNAVFKHLDNFMCYLAWGHGYATGIIIGIKIDQRLGLGLQMLRLVTNKINNEFIHALRTNDLGATIVDAHGTVGPVKMIYIIIKRSDHALVSQLIAKYHPDSFYTIEDVKEANKGVFPQPGANNTLFYLRKLFPLSAK